MKKLTFEGGKTLNVYDDLFSLSFRLSAYTFALSSHFKIGWGDGITEERIAHRYLHSLFSPDDVMRLGIIEQIRNSSAGAELDGYTLEKTVLNLSVPSDTHFVHTHPEEKILLYYVNPEWQDGWHGETLFYDEACKDIVFATPYTPGRLISFSGSIPHAIRPQSRTGPLHRFTLALIFNKGQ